MDGYKAQQGEGGLGVTAPSNLTVDAVGAKYGGAATVLQTLVAAALRNPSVARLTVFASPADRRSFLLPFEPKLEVVEVPLGERGVWGRAAWHHIGLRAAVRERRSDALLCLSGGGIGPRDTPTIQYIQQSLPFSREALATLGYGDYLRARAIGWNMRVSAARSTGVAVQTETMKEWIAERFRLDPRRVRVFEPSVAPLPAATNSPQLAGFGRAEGVARFLYVGNSSPHKNLVLLKRAMELLRQRGIETRLCATVNADHPLTSAPNVEAVGYLSAESLGEAYRLARALVMPSFAETVGLPMLEAMAVGTPVIAADRPYAREVCKDAALYFDPFNADELADRMETVAANDSVRRRLAEAGSRLTHQRAMHKGDEALISWLVALANNKEL